MAVLLRLLVVLAAATALPATAQAAKVRLAGEARVAADGRASVALTNPLGRALRGTLTLRDGARSAGSTRFRVPARSTRAVEVGVRAAVARRVEAAGRLRVNAIVTAAGTARAARVLVLRRGARPTGRAPAAPTPPPAHAAPAPAAPAPAAPPAAEPVLREGRFHGRYAGNATDLSFNVTGGRLWTGAFEAFYVEATCRNADPGYTGPDQEYMSARAIEPVEAAVAADGSFAGDGLHHTGSTPPIAWRLTGRATSPTTLEGQLTTTYQDGYGNTCSGTTRFAARWIGAYTVG